MLQAMKMPDAKVAAEKEWENLRRYQHGSWRKSEIRMKWLPKQGMKEELMVLCHLKNSEVEP